MMNLKDLEIERKRYTDLANSITKLEGEKKALESEKTKIEQSIKDAGFKDIEDVRQRKQVLEARITELRSKIQSKIE